MDCPPRQKKWPLVMVRLYYKKKITGVPSLDSSIRLSVFILLFYLQDTAIISGNIKNKYYLYFYYN